MKSFIFLILTIVNFSCQENLKIEGRWERIEYLDEERIPEVTSDELGVPLSHNLIVEIFNDSLTFIQKNKARSVQFRLIKNYLVFPDDKNKHEMKWKIISYDDKYLLIERNIRGAESFYVKVKFKKDRLTGTNE